MNGYYAYTLYHNQGPDRFFKPGTEEDPYFVGYAGVIGEDDVITLAGETPSEVTPNMFEWVFARHNADDRPDGKTAPSLSVGDIVAITRYGRDRVKTEWRTVDSVGFHPVGIPVNVTEREDA